MTSIHSLQHLIEISKQYLNLLNFNLQMQKYQSLKRLKKHVSNNIKYLLQFVSKTYYKLLDKKNFKRKSSFLPHLKKMINNIKFK